MLPYAHLIPRHRRTEGWDLKVPARDTWDD